MGDHGLPVERLRLNPRGDLGGLEACVLIKEDACDEQVEEWLDIAEWKAAQFSYPHYAVVLKRKGIQDVDMWWVVVRETTFTGTFTVRYYFKDWTARLGNREFHPLPAVETQGPGEMREPPTRLDP